MSLTDPRITFEADKTPMSPQATQGCEARKGEDGLALARPVARPQVWQEPSTYGTIPGRRGFQPPLGRCDTKRARGRVKRHAQSQECAKGFGGNYIAIEKKGYQTGTSSSVDHARTVASSVFWNFCFSASLVMVGVSSFGAEVSRVCDGWVVLTISEEGKTSVWI